MNINVNVESHGDRSHVTTTGLSKLGRPELTVRNLRPDEVADAEALVSFVSEYVAECDVAAGETVGIEYPGAALLVRLLPIETKKSRLGGLFGQKTQVMHAIVDAHESELSHPAHALATIVNLRADALEAQGDSDGATELRLASVRRFPGKENVRPEPNFGVPYNWQNAETYLRLSHAADWRDGQIFMVDRAVKRSQRIAKEVLGASLDELTQLTESEIRARVELILANSLADDDIPVPKALEARLPSGASIIPSPLWEEHDGRAVRQLVIMPDGLARKYQLGALASFGFDKIVDFIATTFVDAIEDPVDLACALRESLSVLGDGHGPLIATDSDYHPADYLISALVAHTVRCLSRGDLELAREALSADPSEPVQLELAALREAETREFRAAVR